MFNKKQTFICKCHKISCI